MRICIEKQFQEKKSGFNPIFLFNDKLDFFKIVKILIFTLIYKL